MGKSKLEKIPSGWSKVGNEKGPDWDAVRDFARQALIFHDREVGLEAEIWRYKNEVHNLTGEVQSLRREFENSLSWKIGRAILWPTRVIRTWMNRLSSFRRNSHEETK